MSGAGTFGAGLEPAGLDPMGAPSAAASLGPQPTAMNFNIGSRAYVMNANGAMASIHPIDSRVQLAIGIALGSIGAAPGIGTMLLAKVTRGSLQQLTSQAIDAVQVALQTMARAGQIAVLSVGVFQPTPNQLIVQVGYVNLVTTQIMKAAVSIF